MAKKLQTRVEITSAGVNEFRGKGVKVDIAAVPGVEVGKVYVTDSADSVTPASCVSTVLIDHDGNVLAGANDSGAAEELENANKKIASLTEGFVKLQKHAEKLEKDLAKSNDELEKLKAAAKAAAKSTTKKSKTGTQSPEESEG